MTFDGFDAQMLIEPTMMGNLIQPEEEGGGGSGGPSTHEQSVTDSILPWDTIVWSDDMSMMTASGLLYIDRDANGWFDYVEYAEAGTLWQWKDEEGWKPRGIDE